MLCEQWRANSPLFSPAARKPLYPPEQQQRTVTSFFTPRSAPGPTPVAAAAAAAPKGELEDSGVETPCSSHEPGAPRTAAGNVYTLLPATGYVWEADSPTHSSHNALLNSKPETQVIAGSADRARLSRHRTGRQVQ